MHMLIQINMIGDLKNVRTITIMSRVRAIKINLGGYKIWGMTNKYT